MTQFTFIFFHHDVQGPFHIERLHAGAVPYGGGVARLRLLFSLAMQGHTVYLVGNVHAGEYRGVRALAGEGALEMLVREPGHPKVVVLNNPPHSDRWSSVAGLRERSTRLVMWAGNPFPDVWMRRLASNAVDRIVCVSHAHREEYRLYPGFERTEMIYSGADFDLMEAAPSAIPSESLVLFASIPRRSKGLHNLLQAWPTVRKAVPCARLRVTGSARMHDPAVAVGRTGLIDADLEAEFSEFFGDHPSSTEHAGIQLTGPRPVGEVFSDLKAAAVAVVNCNWRGSFETYCRSAVEAQFVGTPVVGAARGSLPEVIAHDKTGLLVDREDPRALAAVIVTLLTDPTLRKRLGSAGRAWAQPFGDLDLLAGDWRGVAQRAWSGEPAPSPAHPLRDALRRAGYGRGRLWLRDHVRGTTP
ncbi:MAG: glycosyltransferase family 4 protein [Acidobacteriia bacterium]|nr:glycosyltransferase family 4 protein [Terriglobia bacterium]